MITISQPQHLILATTYLLLFGYWLESFYSYRILWMELMGNKLEELEPAHLWENYSIMAVIAGLWFLQPQHFTIFLEGMMMGTASNLFGCISYYGAFS